MSSSSQLETAIRKLLQNNDLSFRDFVEFALYHPQLGYYARRAQPEADYVTSPRLSPLFASILARLVRDFSSHAGDALSTVVDVGCGDGSLIYSLSSVLGPRVSVRFYGVDRTVERIAVDNSNLRFVRAMEEVPRDGAHLIIANELFDAFPFA